MYDVLKSNCVQLLTQIPLATCFHADLLKTYVAIDLTWEVVTTLTVGNFQEQRRKEHILWVILFPLFHEQIKVTSIHIPHWAWAGEHPVGAEGPVWAAFILAHRHLQHHT